MATSASSLFSTVIIAGENFGIKYAKLLGTDFKSVIKDSIYVLVFWVRIGLFEVVRFDSKL